MVKEETGMGVIVYGSELAAERKAVMKEKLAVLKKSGARMPCLAVIMAGNDAPSLSYIRAKEKACAYVGMDSRMFTLPADCTQLDLEDVICRCNEDGGIDGILLQLPLPDGLDAERALRMISPSKDVDGLHPINVARLQLRKPGFVPCTPQGVIYLLEKMGAAFEGARAVVVGRSQLVGMPVSKLLLDRNATVTMCHSHTRNLAQITSQADILVVAVGSPKLITPEYVREGAYVVDVGVNRLSTGKLCGDVDTEAVLPKCAAITPVPKGVGPMTICCLLENTMKAYQEHMNA